MIGRAERSSTREAARSEREKTEQVEETPAETRGHVVLCTCGRMMCAGTCMFVEDSIASPREGTKGERNLGSTGLANGK